MPIHEVVRKFADLDAERLWIGLLLSLTLSFAAYRLRVLDAGGATVAGFLGVIIFGIGGWQFSAPILCFFVLSSALSKISESRRPEIHNVFQKSSRRDAGQVLANGGIAAALVLIAQASGEPAVYLLYVGAIAAVTADTWATEIGVLGGQMPRLITTGRRVAAGTSGGVTLFGVIGAILGALTIAAVGWMTRPAPIADRASSMAVLALTICGVAGHFLDSMLGATIQAQYVCPACGKQTERLRHCGGTQTQFSHGRQWVNNDIVNGCCALGGALMASAVFSILPNSR